MRNPLDNFFARGGLWALVQFLLKAAVIGLGPWYRSYESHPALVITGWIFLVIGTLVFMAGLLVLGRNLTPFPEPRRGAELVQRGIYNRIRHPLYAGVMAIAVGWALIWQSIPAFLAALALVPFFHAKTRREERWLCARFPGYAEYMKRVPRFVPRLRTGANLICNH